ncbi:MAG TPA: lipopolysaccharide biosynthesis protein [Pyrinomonadaceae bacterium]|nr:lipopolysaccharide biosynthesis protein [Pyrinomonadaceae bacterium]
MPSENSSPQITEDADRHFRTDHLKDDLGSRSARGGMVTLGAQVFKLVFSTAAAIVMARLLTPEDYGLIGMVAILVNFVGMFQYLGLSTATVKWSQLEHRQVSTLFWVNMALSAAIMLATFASGPLLARFYKEPRLNGIALGYGIVLLLTGLTIQHQAILMRQMRFAVIAVIEVSAMVIGLSAAIAAALAGARYWALVVNQIALWAVVVVGSWTACTWRPGWPSRGVGLRSMLTYGGNLTGYNFLHFFARNLDNALIGKFWGAYQLGVYSRAYQLLMMPIGQIITPLWSVAVPALSRLSDAPERYRSAYLKMLEKIAMLTMPGVVFMCATSDWLIRVLLGPQWADTGRIFMLLGIAAVTQPATSSALWLFQTQGRAKEMLRWGFIGSSIAVCSILAGLPWGAGGVALAYALSDLLVATPLLFWYVGRRGPVRTMDFYRTIAPAVVASLGVLAVLLISRQWLESIPNLILRLAVAFAVSVAIAISIFSALPAGRQAMRSLKAMLVMVIKRQRESVA